MSNTSGIENNMDDNNDIEEVVLENTSCVSKMAYWIQNLFVIIYKNL